MFYSLAIDPIVFSIGSLPVHWYGLILGLGALAGLYLCILEGKRYGISQEFFMDMLLLGVPSAIIAARIYFVAFKWEDYKDNLWDVFKVWNGGIAIYGALIGAVICGIIYFRYKGYSAWRLIDICAPGLLAGQMIGRWGNFVNQEAYGGVVEESFLRDKLHLPDFIVNQMYIGDAYHHPAFLYESLWCLLGIVLLFVLRRQKFVRAGEIFISYLIWYSIGRFFIEALRTDSLAFNGSSGAASFINALWSPMKWMGFEQGYLDPAYGNIRVSQLLSLLIIVAAIALIIIRRVSVRPLPYYSDPIVSTKAAAADAVVPESAAGTAEKAPQPEQPLPERKEDKETKE